MQFFKKDFPSLKINHLILNFYFCQKCKYGVKFGAIMERFSSKFKFKLLKRQKKCLYNIDI